MAEPVPVAADVPVSVCIVQRVSALAVTVSWPGAALTVGASAAVMSVAPVVPDSTIWLNFFHPGAVLYDCEAPWGTLRVALE